MIDNYWGKILPQIFSAFEKCGIPDFQGSQLDQFRSAIWEMMKRTPEFMPDLDPIEKGREAILTILQEDNGNLLASRREVLAGYLEDDTKLKQYGRNIIVRGSMLESEKVEEVLKEFHLRWILLDQKHSFILSGLMAYRIGNGGSNGLINPNAEVWFPISPKIAAILVRDPSSNIPLVSYDARDHVRSVNRFAVRNSRFVASHSETLLNSLVRFGGTLD